MNSVRTRLSVLAIALCVAGCASRPVSEVLTDPRSSVLSIEYALKRMTVDDAPYVWPVVWNRRIPLSTRHLAWQELARLQGDSFWDVIEKRGSIDYVLARDIAQHAPVERLAGLFHHLVVARAYRMSNTVMADAFARIPNVAQLVEQGIESEHSTVAYACWQIMSSQSTDQNQSRKRLASLTDSSALYVVSRVAPYVDLLPTTEEECLQAEALLGKLECLEDVTIEGSAVRHLPLFRRVAQKPEGLSRLRQQAENLADRLSQEVRYVRDDEFSRSSKKLSELSDADRLWLSAVRASLDLPHVSQALCVAAHVDTLDKSSEHGGVLVWDESGKLRYVPVEPLRRVRDTLYIPRMVLFEQLRDGLAHVHFHAQQDAMADKAGPGGGDLDMCQRHRIAAIVLTRITPQILNADAYFPDGTVVDLGSVK